MSEIIRADQAAEMMQAPEDSVAASNLLINTKAMNTIFKIAKMYSVSTMVPKTYQGSPENCLVACELAARMNVSPVLVMQNLYIVQGRPSWAGQACIALINGCGQFDGPLEFVFVGERGTLTHGCYARTMRNGVELRSTTITLQLAKDEGWLDKPGSKWKTMPEQMMQYRAAAFFARIHCPHVLMGFTTADEARDIEPEEKPKTIIKL